MSSVDASLMTEFSGDQWMKPFHTGWRREIVFRLEAVSTLCDVYYYHPSGLKMRSLAEIEAFLTNHPEEGLTIDCFTYAKEALLHVQESVRIAGPRGPTKELQFLREDVNNYLTNYYPGYGESIDALNVMYHLRNFLVVNLRRNLIETKYPQFRNQAHIRAEMEGEWKDNTPANEPIPQSLVFRTAAGTFDPARIIARRGVPRGTALERDDRRPPTSDNGAEQSRTAAAGGEVFRGRQRKQRFPRRVEGDRVQERLSPPIEIPGTTQAQERVPSPSGIPSTSRAQEHVSLPSEIPSTSQAQEHVSSQPHTPSTSQSQVGPLPIPQSHTGFRESQAHTASRTLSLPPAPGTHTHHPLSPSHHPSSSGSHLPSSSSSEPSRALHPPLPGHFLSQLLQRRVLIRAPHSARTRRAPRATVATETPQTHQAPEMDRATRAQRAPRGPRGRRSHFAPRAPRIRRAPVAPRIPRRRRSIPSQIPEQGGNLPDSEMLDTEQGDTEEPGQVETRTQETPVVVGPETSAVIPQSESSSSSQNDEASGEGPSPRSSRNSVSPQFGSAPEDRTDEGPREEPESRRPSEPLPRYICRRQLGQSRHRRSRPRFQSATRATTRVSSILIMAPGSTRPQMIRVTDTIVPTPSASSRSQVHPTPSKPRARKVPSRAIAPALHAPPASPLPEESRLPQVAREVLPKEDLHSFPYPEGRKRIRSLPQTREESQTSQGSKKSRSSQGSQTKKPRTTKSSGRFLQSSEPQPSTSREESTSPQATTSRQGSISSRPATPFQDPTSPPPSTSRGTMEPARPSPSPEGPMLEGQSTSRLGSISPRPTTSRQKSKSSKPSISRKRPVTMWPPSSLEDVIPPRQSATKTTSGSSETSSSGADDYGGDTGFLREPSSDEDDI